MQALRDRIENGRELQNRIGELVQAAEKPACARTLWGQWMTSVLPTLHDTVWDRYLRDSFDQIHWYILESARLRALEEFQRQRGEQPRTARSATASASTSATRPASAPATTTFGTPVDGTASPFTVTVTSLPDQQQQYVTPQQLITQAQVSDPRERTQAWNLSLAQGGSQPGSAGSSMSTMLRDVSNTSFSALGFTTPTDSEVDRFSL